MTILEVLRREGLGEHEALVTSLLQPTIKIRTEKLADRPPAPDDASEDDESDADDDEDEDDEVEMEDDVIENDDDDDDDEAAAAFASLDEALDSLPLGASRFGGIPDLPPGASWPMRDEVPMEFVAQLRLADVAGLDPLNRLPPRGSLLFFYNSQWDCSDMAPDAECCAVLFHDGDDSELVRTPPPRIMWKGEFDSKPGLRPWVHGLAKLTFERTQTVPGGVSPYVAGTPLEPIWQDFTAYHSSEWEGSEDGVTDDNRLLGYVAEQDYVEAHANGTDDQLLLQVDSDDNADFCWGDCQKLFFLLRKDELAARDFSKVRIYSQLG